MLNDWILPRSTNRLGDVAEWLRSGLQIRAFSLLFQHRQWENIPQNTRERIVKVGNAAGCA
jgi:hypothetical protein